MKIQAIQIKFYQVFINNENKVWELYLRAYSWVTHDASFNLHKTILMEAGEYDIKIVGFKDTINLNHITATENALTIQIQKDENKYFSSTGQLSGDKLNNLANLFATFYSTRYHRYRQAIKLISEIFSKVILI